MPYHQCGELSICYETLGSPDDEPLLLIMGLGMQLTGWDEAFCRQLARKGFYLIRFDNRDVGLSSRVATEVAPNPIAALMGDLSQVPYTLDEMADDVVGLLDAMSISAAHVVGASMGAMIAQLLAINHPQRVRTLTSIMSTTGDPTVGKPTTEAIMKLVSPPPDDNRESLVHHGMDIRATLASPGFELRESQRRAFVERSLERSPDTSGAARQFSAVLAARDRTEELRKLDVPTLVVHGTADPLIDVSGGHATANAIPGAELMLVDGMGHELPAPVWPPLIDRIVDLARRQKPGH